MVVQTELERKLSHRQFCERFMAATGTGDRAALAELLHPDFECVEADGLPYAGAYRGLDGWMALGQAVVGAWSKFRIRPIEYPGESENSFTVRFAISGVSRKTGKAFETTVLELWHFREGKLITIFPYYFDTHLLATADSE
jgi:ketosteroid isomerase-like protein